MKRWQILFYCILVIVILVFSLSHFFVTENFDGKNEIPMNIFQTWNQTAGLPPNMKKITENIQRENPEFTYKCFNDTECLEFIREHFDEPVANAYTRIIPGAYRADLWRYCVLYIRGGIYMDIKLKPTDGFRFLSIIDKECFVRDIDASGKGIYNAFMVCKPNNTILLQCINKIVENVKNDYYGESVLSPTGPLLMKQFFTESEIDNLEYKLGFDKNNNLVIKNKDDLAVLIKDDDVYNEQNKTKRYNEYWQEKNIYRKE
jgi:mannosyltransferase OCH1-like enzyme